MTHTRDRSGNEKKTLVPHCYLNRRLWPFRGYTTIISKRLALPTTSGGYLFFPLMIDLRFQERTTIEPLSSKSLSRSAARSLGATSFRWLSNLYRNITHTAVIIPSNQRFLPGNPIAKKQPATYRCLQATQLRIRAPSWLADLS
jgi:hypothetical protein